MTTPEFEPASTAWDEHKPPVQTTAPSKDGLIFARVCFWIAAGTILTLAAVIATTIATDLVPDEYGFGLWCLGGALSLIDLLASSVTALMAGSRNRSVMRVALWSVLFSVLSLGAHIATGMYVLSTISFC